MGSLSLKQATKVPLEPLTVVSRSPAQTRRIGACLGELARSGDVFLLIGGLGTGKTCLAQGIGHGLGVNDTVRSPSFIIVAEHQGRLPLYHIDLYRLEARDVMALGLEEYLYGQGVCVVEWAERAFEAFPPEHMLIRLHYLSPRQRQLTFEPRGGRYEGMVRDLELEAR